MLVHAGNFPYIFNTEFLLQLRTVKHAIFDASKTKSYKLFLDLYVAWHCRKERQLTVIHYSCLQRTFYCWYLSATSRVPAPEARRPPASIHITCLRHYGHQILSWHESLGRFLPVYVDCVGTLKSLLRSLYQFVTFCCYEQFWWISDVIADSLKAFEALMSGKSGHLILPSPPVLTYYRQLHG